MKLNRLFCLLSALSATVAGHANTITASWTATNSLHTGLYTANGISTSTTVNLENVSSYETYDVVFNPIGPYTTYQPVSGVWQTELKFRFSSSAWQSVSGLTAIGVQLIHYVLTSYNGSLSISLPVDYFQEPTSSLVTYAPVPGFQVVTDYSPVNPKLFYLSQMSVDPSDPTGKTGRIIWTNCTAATPAPWDDFPSGTTVGGINPQTTFRGMLWVFARPGQPGNHQYLPPMTGWQTYPVPIVEP